jgi:hypothetical protein
MTMRRFTSSSRRLQIALTLAGALAVFGAASTASAHPEFPGIIQEHFNGLGCAPQCSLCHVSPTGGGPIHGEDQANYVGPHRGFGTFVMNLLATPVGGGTLTESNLPTKLDSLGKAPCNTVAMLGDITDTGVCDSDGDGVSDYVEVGRGDDPDANGPGNGATCPKYGCGASSIGALPQRSSDSGHAAAVMAALGVTLVLGRRFFRRA